MDFRHSSYYLLKESFKNGTQNPHTLFGRCITHHLCHIYFLYPSLSFLTLFCLNNLTVHWKHCVLLLLNVPEFTFLKQGHYETVNMGCCWNEKKWWEMRKNGKDFCLKQMRRKELPLNWKRSRFGRKVHWFHFGHILFGIIFKLLVETLGRQLDTQVWSSAERTRLEI